MTPRQFRSLIRDQWRNTYPLFALAFAISIASCLGVLLFSFRAGDITQTDYKLLARVAMGGLHAGNALWIVFLLFATGNDRALGLAMPPYLMRLPINAWALVAARMAYGLASVSVLAAAGTFVYYGLFDAQMEHELPLRTFVVIYPTLYAALQTAAWAFGPFGLIPSVVLTLLCSMIPNGMLFAFRFSPLDQNDYSVRGMLATISIGFLLSGVAVTEHRKRRFASLQSIALFGPAPRAGIREDQRTFASMEEALRWYESRRQWRLYPAALLCCFAALFVLHFAWFPSIGSGTLNGNIPMKFAIAGQADRIQYAIYYGALAATLIASGLFFFQTRRLHRGRNRMFLFIRPVTVRTLAAARLQSGVRAVLRGLGPLLALAIITLFIDIQPGPYNPLTGHPEPNSTFGHLLSRFPVPLAALLCLVTLSGLCATIWACLWLENILVIGSIFSVAAMIIELSPTFRGSTAVDRSTYAFYATSAVALTLYATTLALAARRGLVSLRLLAGLLPILPVLGAGLFLFLSKESVLERRPIDYAPLFTVVPLMLIAGTAPFAVVPLLTQRSRYRR